MKKIILLLLFITLLFPGCSQENPTSSKLTFLEVEQGALNITIKKDPLPNLTCPTSTIEATLPRAGYLKMYLLNATGDIVITLVDRYIEAGTVEVEITSPTEKGKELVDGLYIVYMEIDEFKDWAVLIMDRNPDWGEIAG